MLQKEYAVEFTAEDHNGKSGKHKLDLFAANQKQAAELIFTKAPQEIPEILQVVKVSKVEVTHILNKIITQITGTNRRDIFHRIQITGRADLLDNGWATNKVPNWIQPEWFSPALIADFIAQGLLIQDGRKLLLTEDGSAKSYDEGARTKYVRKEVTTEVGEDGVPKKRTRVVPAGKLSDDSKLKLLKVAKANAGEALFLKIWDEMPNKIGTINTLAEAFRVAGAANQKDPLVSSKYYCKAILKRGDAQIEV